MRAPTAIALGIMPVWSGMACDNLCTVKNVVLSCRLRIHYAEKHEHLDHPDDSCVRARDKVVEECPVCAGCTLEHLGGYCAKQASTTEKPTTTNQTTTTQTRTKKTTPTKQTTAKQTTTKKATTEQPSSKTKKTSTMKKGKASSTEKATNTSTTVTATTTTSDPTGGFCCSAAVDNDDFCGTCWVDAPSMNDEYCRKSQETCEDCGHVWCNRTQVKEIKGSCKTYGCVDFEPFHECQCNPECSKFGSCCDDFEDQCGKRELESPGKEADVDEVQGEADGSAENLSMTCKDFGCINDYRPLLPCQCNDECAAHSSCCDDYEAECVASLVEDDLVVSRAGALSAVRTPLGVAACVCLAAALLTLFGIAAARRSWERSTRTVHTVVPNADSRKALVE